jgi:hypothetical protein
VDSFILRDLRDAKTLATMIRTLYQKAEWRSRMGQAAAVWDLLRNAVGKKRQLSTKKI